MGSQEIYLKVQKRHVNNIWWMVCQFPLSILTWPLALSLTYYLTPAYALKYIVLKPTGFTNFCAIQLDQKKKTKYNHTLMLWNKVLVTVFTVCAITLPYNYLNTFVL